MWGAAPTKKEQRVQGRELRPGENLGSVPLAQVAWPGLGEVMAMAMTSFGAGVIDDAPFTRARIAPEVGATGVEVRRHPASSTPRAAPAPHQASCS